MEIKEIYLGEIEARYADLIWENIPDTTGNIYRLCKEKFNRTMSTNATVLRRLCQKGLFRVENRVVYAVVSRKEFYVAQSEQFIEENFGGSFAGFFNTFAKRHKLTPEEIADMRALIDAYELELSNGGNICDDKEREDL